MNESNEEKLEKHLKPNATGVAGVTLAQPILTSGEIFTDGSMIELFGNHSSVAPLLSLWDGEKEIVGARIAHHDQIYVPAPISRSILQQLTLPTECRQHGTTRQLLAEICKLVQDFVGLPEQSASLVGRFALCSWLLEAFQVAPALVLAGPDVLRGSQLMAVLHCLCRHGLRMTGLTPAGFRSLPHGLGFTFLVSQPRISEKLESLLCDARHRDQKIPNRGELLDLFGVQIIHSASVALDGCFPGGCVEIPLVPGAQQLPTLDSDHQHGIAADFQPKLLNFRRANLCAARKLEFDSAKFIFPMREFARDLAAATPDDAELQNEVYDLLREADADIRSERWIDLRVIAAETVSLAYKESPGGMVYVSDLATKARVILNCRGESMAEVSPAVLGKVLKTLGFTTEPRDARGKKLHLTESVCNRALQLVRDFGGPEPMNMGSVKPR